MARKLGGQARECDERLTRAFALLGKRWSGVILGLLLQGPAHFTVLARGIPGISERMLSDRLSELAAAGIVEREVIPGPPLRVLYRLTENGRALGPGLIKLGEWADLYMPPAPTRGKKKALARRSVQ